MEAEEQKPFSAQLLCRGISLAEIKVKSSTQKCVGDPHKSSAMETTEREQKLH